MEAKIRSRKLEHIHYVLQDDGVDRSQAGFDRIQLIHRALPEIDFDEVDTSISFLGRKIQAPLLISSMTGGDHEQLIRINQTLAQSAQQTGLAMAVGSMRIALERPEAKKSFDLRSLAPDVPLLANLGAVQLNYGCGLDSCLNLVDLLQADALILHLNPLQEAVQPEGDRNFRGLLAKIEYLASHLPVPIIVKEVGAGFCAQDIKCLRDAGVRWIDVAGRGGTSWSRIEAHRSGESLGMLFQDWGIPTPQVLQMASRLYPDMHLIASGGVRHGIDVIKALIFGAQLAGMAKPFLVPAVEGVDALVHYIETLKREIKVGMFLLGQSNVNSMIGNRELILESGYA